MSLFKHAMVSGINDALVDRGFVAWPNEEVGFEVCSKVAAELSGPDMLPEGGLEGGSALLIGQRLKEASDNLAAYGYTPDPASALRTKQASQMNFADRAAILAEACMSKAASDASLTNVGTNTAESAVQTDQHAALDQRNRPTNKYLMGVGRTAFPNGGVVGQQMVYPGGPSQAGHNSLTSLDKQAFSLTDAGHELDEKHYRRIADALHGMSDDSDVYTSKEPLLAHLTGEQQVALLNRLQGQRMDYKARQHAKGDNAYNPFGGLLTPRKKESAMSDRARAMLLGSGVGAVGGGIAGGMSDDEHSARNALLGMGVGGALGAGGGAGIEELLRHLERSKRAPGGGAAAAAPEMVAPVAAPAAAAPLADVPATGASPVMSEASGSGGEEATGLLARLKDALKARMSPKTASEDMSADDLGVDPAEAERAMLFLQGLKNKGYAPGAEAQVAAAGLGQAGDPGMEVMAHILDNVKTASEADATFSQILQHQFRTNKLASTGLVNHIQGHMGGRGSAKAANLRSASLLSYLKAAADGSLTDVGANTAESAAEHDQVAELDLKNRAANAYLRGVGNSGLPGGKQVFDISKVPGGEAVSNSVTEGTKSAEVAYVNSFRKIASEMGPHLPATMGRDEKVAHLQTMLGLPPNERVGYLKALRAG